MLLAQRIKQFIHSRHFCIHFPQIEAFIKTQGHECLQHLCQPREVHAVQSNPNEKKKLSIVSNKRLLKSPFTFLVPAETILDYDPECGSIWKL